ncbi:proto oncogene tyrosine protein kinase receptor [Echinococcus multilocularis]|uniref:Proto oncogene tyrosine protein kinase receptor n=1 Tax=Echinococcus multilocularis TaxID=6211 RepID=A0A0S4MK47_ECHMU|nr:proto oncogene tyrosine protein kinase receptor [Echinococcus multilocularis]
MMGCLVVVALSVNFGKISGYLSLYAQTVSREVVFPFLLCGIGDVVCVGWAERALALAGSSVRSLVPPTPPPACLPARPLAHLTAICKSPTEQELLNPKACTTQS